MPAAIESAHQPRPAAWRKKARKALVLPAAFKIRVRRKVDPLGYNQSLLRIALQGICAGAISDGRPYCVSRPRLDQEKLSNLAPRVHICDRLECNN